MPKLGEALLQAFKAHGAHEIFGIPGDFVLPLFKVIEESNILPSFTLSHEPAVGFAADATARYHGGLGVAVVTYGAGAFNLVNSIAGAYAERSPVVVIAKLSDIACAGLTMTTMLLPFEPLVTERADAHTRHPPGPARGRG